MRTALLIASGVFLVAVANVAVSVPAQAKSMKECAAQWKEMKAANQTNGMKYRDFSKQCMSGEAAPAAAPTAEAPPPPAATPAPPPKSTAAAPPPAKSTAAAKPVSGGRQAMLVRERACGAEWKADKAAGKVPAGMKWPQYWSACDKRKKAEGI